MWKMLGLAALLAVTGWAQEENSRQIWKRPPQAPKPQQAPSATGGSASRSLPAATGSRRCRARCSARVRPPIPGPAPPPAPDRGHACQSIATARAIRRGRDRPHPRAGAAAAARRDWRARPQSGGTPGDAAESVRRRPLHGRRRRWIHPAAEAHPPAAPWATKRSGRRPRSPRSAPRSSRVRWSMAGRLPPRQAATEPRRGTRSEGGEARD